MRKYKSFDELPLYSGGRKYLIPKDSLLDYIEKYLLS